MKMLAGVLFLISINSFAQVVPNVTGIERRVERVVCKGAYQMSTEGLEAVAKESGAVCASLPDENQVELCNLKLFKKHGVLKLMTSMHIIAVAGSNSTFNALLLENGRLNFDRFAYAEKFTADGLTAVSFDTTNEDSVPFSLATTNLNAANTFSQGLYFEFEGLIDGSWNTYVFVDGCTFTY